MDKRFTVWLFVLLTGVLIGNCSISSGATLTSVSVTPVTAEIQSGRTIQFTTTGIFSDGTARNLTAAATWSSSNTAVATVSNQLGSKGLGTALASGSTTVTATLNGLSGKAALIVNLSSVTVIPFNPVAAIGGTQQFIATGTFTDGTKEDLTALATWSSSNTAAATINAAGIANALSGGTTTIAGSLGNISGSTLLTVNSIPLTLAQTLSVTTDGEGGSARPEIVATSDRLYMVYLGHIGDASTRSFDVKILKTDLVTQVLSRTIVAPSVDYGSPTDIRIAADSQSLYAFYETFSDSTGKTYLWGAKYALNDNFDKIASTPAPIAVSRQVVNPPDCHELLNDPAPLIGPNSVFVITRYDCSLSKEANTIYRVREFDKDSLAPVSGFDLDLSAAADGRGRVTSLLYRNNSIYMALATTVSDQGLIETSDDSVPSDVVLVRMNPDWTFDPLADVRAISAEPDDRENYITGLRTDGTYFYLCYKQAVGAPPTGEQRAIIKIFDGDFNLLHKEIVTSVVWGPGGGEIRPSLEVFGKTIYSGQDMGQSLGTGNAQIFLYGMP